jgi:hypothetical protein
LVPVLVEHDLTYEDVTNLTEEKRNIETMENEGDTKDGIWW